MPIDNLFQAIETSDIAALKRLLKEGADIDEVDVNEYQATPLSYACDWGQELCVQTLLEAGADVNLAAFTPPLVAAATHGFTSIVKVLLAAGADLENADESGQSALWIAAAQGFADIARLLVEAGASRDQADLDGIQPAIIAEENGHATLAAYLTDPAKYPASHPFWRDSDQAALSAARARRKQLDEIVQSANSTVEEPKWKFSKGIASYQVNGGKITQDFTSIAHDGNLELARAMLDAGLNPDWTQFRGHVTALMTAARAGELEMIRLLLERGANPNYQNEQGLSALHMALFKPSVRRHLPVVKQLLAAGADPNAADGTGQRPLHRALRYALPGIVQALIAAGGDPFISDHAGRKPADWAPDNGKNAAAIHELLEAAKDAGRH